jgi:DNA-dependent RNA polymerase auxiliary subunit epsilon
MLYKVDYVKRSDRQPRTEYVDFVANQVEATKKFMRKFFEDNPGDAVKITGMMLVEVIGDGSILVADGGAE